MTTASSPTDNPVTCWGFVRWGLFLSVQRVGARTCLPCSFCILSLPRSFKSWACCQPEGWRRRAERIRGVTEAPLAPPHCPLSPGTREMDQFSPSRRFTPFLWRLPQALSGQSQIMRPTQFSTRPVILNLGCRLETPGELLKRGHVWSRV